MPDPTTAASRFHIEVDEGSRYRYVIARRDGSVLDVGSLGGDAELAALDPTAASEPVLYAVRNKLSGLLVPEGLGVRAGTPLIWADRFKAQTWVYQQARPTDFEVIEVPA